MMGKILEKKHNLREGLGFAYHQLLTCMAQDRIMELSQFCEKRIYREVHEGMEGLVRETSRIDIVNQENFLENFKVEVVDLTFTFGASIDRDEN
jgi:hypothetical protein